MSPRNRRYDHNRQADFTLLIPKVIIKSANVRRYSQSQITEPVEVQLKARSSVRDSLWMFFKQQVIRMFAAV
jgi:hypothetical protein